MRIASSAFALFVATIAAPYAGVAQVLTPFYPVAFSPVEREHQNLDHVVPVATVNLVGDAVRLADPLVVQDPSGEPFVLGAASLDLRDPPHGTIAFTMTNGSSQPIPWHADPPIKMPSVQRRIAMKLMSKTFFTTLTLWMLAGQPIPALAQGVESTSVEADKALAVSLWHISVATHTRIGFESVEAFYPGGLFRYQAEPEATTRSLDDALNAAIAVNPRYEWRRMGQFVVVRPIAAWSDGADPFNRPVRQFRAERTNESQVLKGIQVLILTGVYKEDVPMNGTPVNFTVESGTVVDVMNRLAESAEITFWQGGYQPQAQPSQTSLSLTLVNDRHMRATMVTHQKISERISAN